MRGMCQLGKICTNGLSYSGRTYCPLKEAHHNLPFRDAGATTCADERDVSIGKVCSRELSQFGTCTDERYVSIWRICSSDLSQFGTCTNERYVSIGTICSSDQSGACNRPLTDKHHGLEQVWCPFTERYHAVPLQDACTAARTDEGDASMRETATVT